MRATEFIKEYREEYQGITLDMNVHNHQLIVRALDDWGNNELGHVVFNIGDDNELDPQDLEVDDRYRGQGVARVMYDYVKNQGYKIHRSWDQTSAGSAFWDKHRGDQRIWEESELTESASSIVYHYTNTMSAAQIMSIGEFLLASSTGTQAEQYYEIPGYPYFLSTTRSKVGDYHNRYVGSSAVMFVLSGDWLNHHYKTKPIDYWERAWIHSDGTRGRESEDRVYSKKPSIPANSKSILEIHVLLKEQLKNRSAEVRTILISAKKQNIPAFLYTDETAWKLQDKRKAVDLAQTGDLLKGEHLTRKMYSPRRNYLEDWLELIYKKNKGELSASAQKKARSLVYYGQSYPESDEGLGVDMSNARKPGNDDYDSVVKINNFMRQNKIVTPVDLKNYLINKWKDLY
jgi:hypothetical protein